MTDENAIREKILNDISDIIRSARIGRGAAEVSTPEQIVHMTARVIEDNLIAYANGEPSNYRWFPQAFGVAADIRREIEGSPLLSAKAKGVALRAVERGASGWPA